MHSACSGMHKDSKIMTKAKPAVRIIHIFAPEIINTDVENFRDLVQKLTGKPTEDKKNSYKMKLVKKSSPIITSTSNNVNILPKKWELCTSVYDPDDESIMKSGGFLGGFSDLDREGDGFIDQDIGGFPLMLPNFDHHAHNSHIHAYDQDHTHELQA